MHVALLPRPQSGTVVGLVYDWHAQLHGFGEAAQVKEFESWIFLEALIVKMGTSHSNVGSGTSLLTAISAHGVVFHFDCGQSALIDSTQVGDVSQPHLITWIMSFERFLVQIMVDLMYVPLEGGAVSGCRTVPASFAHFLNQWGERLPWAT